VSRLTETSPHVLVAGAGINGLLSAYYLHKAGMQVTLCDRGPIPNPHSASHGVHRLIHPWSTAAPGSADWQRDIRDSTEALRLWQTLLQATGCDGFARTGVLVAAPEAEDATLWQDQPLPGGAVPLTAPEAEALLAGATATAGALYFPDFGPLLADRILTRLSAALSHGGVRLRPHCPLRDCDPACGEVVLGAHPEDCRAERFAAVVLATGWRSRALLRAAGLAALRHPFAPKRSYVLYLPPHDLPPRLLPRTAWTRFLGEDLWGMPSVRGQEVKFGCGLLTHDADEPPYPPEQIRDGFVRAYGEADPDYDILYTGRVASNIWADCPGSDRFRQSGRCVLVTSDSGGGFKFAPLTGRAAARAVLTTLQNDFPAMPLLEEPT